MNYYEHNLGDWAKKCSHLSFAEEGCYRRLLDWYYTHERPLPLAVRELYKIARCRSRGDQNIVKRVIAEFFEPAEDGFHQAHADKLLEKYTQGLPVTIRQKVTQNLRQQRTRERRARLFEALADHGIHAPWNAKTTELFEALKANGIKPPVIETVSTPVTPKNVTGADAGPGNLSRLEPITNNQGVTGLAVALTVTQSDSSLRAHLSSAHVSAIRKAGFPSASGSDPRLAALVEAGVTPEECALVATEAVSRGKGWSWMLATIKGRREDAQQLAQAGVPVEPIRTYRQRAADAVISKFAPDLVEKPENGLGGV